MAVTKAEQSPVTRIVVASGREFIAVMEGRVLTLKPKRVRKGGPAEVQIPWGTIYNRALLARVEPLPKRKRSRR